MSHDFCCVHAQVLHINMCVRTSIEWDAKSLSFSIALHSVASFLISDYNLHCPLFFFPVPLFFLVGMNGKSILSALSRHTPENSVGMTPGSGATTSICSSRSSSQRSGTGGHTPRGPHRSPSMQPRPPAGSSSSSSNALALSKTTNSPRLSPGQSRVQVNNLDLCHTFLHIGNCLWSNIAWSESCFVERSLSKLALLVKQDARALIFWCDNRCHY